jgi:hypothetical protein
MARTAGSNCYTNITMAQLKQILPDAALIPVKKLWLKNLGLNIESETTTLKSESAILKNENPEEKEPDFKIIDFNNEETEKVA